MTRRSKVALAAALVLLAGAGALWAYFEYQKDCCAFPDPKPEAYLRPVYAEEGKPHLGLMSGLPLLWPIDGDVTAIADGTAHFPWQTAIFNAEHEVIALDTLSPYPGLVPDMPEIDPLARFESLAVIQPRALTPQDNVALDDWVRSGGTLLLVLDPMLTGDYEFALGDPRRPIDSALIPPVVTRWGMEITFDEEQAPHRRVPMPFYEEGFDLFLAGTVKVAEGADTQCDILGEGVLAVCKVGEGTVTLLADAGVFEHGPVFEVINDESDQGRYNQLANEGTKPLIALMRYAFSR